jgi:hypothetical protein
LETPLNKRIAALLAISLLSSPAALAAESASSTIENAPKNPLDGVVSLNFASYMENYPTGQAQTRIDAVPLLGFALNGRHDDWLGHAKLFWDNAAYEDSNLPLSAHLRQEWRGSATIGHRFEQGPAGAEFGIGYFARWENATHTGAPPTASYAFSNNRVFHGPELTLNATWKLPSFLDAFSLNAEAGVAPIVFSHIDTGLNAMPPLWSNQIDLTLQTRLASTHLALGYRRWEMRGPGYQEVFQGPTFLFETSAF